MEIRHARDYLLLIKRSTLLPEFKIDAAQPK